MEVLSIGEKIKRARIYKNYTLKDLCGDRISVSKMSCIENNKIDIDDDALGFIAKKLDVDKDYISETIEEQLTKNLNVLKNMKSSPEYEDLLKYNIDVANRYKYFNISFKLTHNLFNYYLNINHKEKCRSIIPQYYSVYQNSDNPENKLNYLMDIGNYLFLNEEFTQALSYYMSIIDELKGRLTYLRHDEILICSKYNIVDCYFMMEDIDNAYKFGINLIDFTDRTNNKILKADIYHMMGIFSIRDKNIDKFKYYEKKSYKYYDNNYCKTLQAITDFSSTMFKFGFQNLGKEYTKIAIERYLVEEYSKYDINKIIKFTLRNIKTLIENNMIDMAQDICDKILNYSIDLNNEKYIEESYYYKAIISKKQHKLKTAEMYANLSLDILLRCGSNFELYNRYMEIANAYHGLGYVSESLKYFSIAISLKNKI